MEVSLYNQTTYPTIIKQIYRGNLVYVQRNEHFRTNLDTELSINIMISHYVLKP